MDSADYMALVTDAFSKLEKFYRDREAIELEIMKTEQLIAAVANMLPDNAKDLAIRRIKALQEFYRVRDAGLTDAIRVILKTSGGWQTVTNVRDRLREVGFNFGSYSSNPLASISAILRRLKEEEVETAMVDGGVTAYRWKDTSEFQFSSQFLRAAMETTKAMQKGKKSDLITPPPRIEDLK